MNKRNYYKINRDNSVSFVLKDKVGSFGERLYSFKDMDITVNGPIKDKNKFINNLGGYMSYKPDFKKGISGTPSVVMEITIKLKRPMYIDEFKFDGGEDSRMFNATKLVDVKCLKGYLWQQMDDFNKFDKVKIVLENTNTRGMLDNIINEFVLNFKDDGLILNREYTIRDYREHYRTILGNMMGGMDYSEYSDEDLKAFLVRYKNKMTNAVYENLIFSYSEKPILSEYDEIIEYKFI